VIGESSLAPSKMLRSSKAETRRGGPPSELVKSTEFALTLQVPPNQPITGTSASGVHRWASTPELEHLDMGTWGHGDARSRRGRMTLFARS
jgi:hypothetical protein